MRRGDWKWNLSMVVILIASIILSYTLIRAATPPTLEELQSQGLNVRDEPPNSLWWLKNTGGEPHYECVEVAGRIKGLAAISGSTLNVTYGNIFINQYNNTVWLVITDTSSNRIKQIEELIGTHERVKIIYLKAPALYTELNRYAQLVVEKSKYLKEKGVNISMVGVSENATLLIGLESVTPYSVNTLISNLPEVPRFLMVIRRVGQAVLI